MQTYTYVMDTYTNAHTHTRIRTHAHVHAHTHIRTCTRTYTHTIINTLCKIFFVLTIPNLNAKKCTKIPLFRIIIN